MKLLIVAILLVYSSSLVSDWKLVAVYNQSDLHLDGAYRLKGSGKNKKNVSTFVDKRIKSAKTKSVVMIDYKVAVNASSQGYLCIHLIRKNNISYELCFDSQANHAIAWKRSKANGIAQVSSQELAEGIDGSLTARAILKQGDVVIAHAKQPYDDEQSGAEFDIVIQGKDGSYTLDLKPAA